MEPNTNQSVLKRTISFGAELLSQAGVELKYSPLSRSDFDMKIIRKWTELKTSEPPKRRCNHSSFIFNNWLYIYGGSDINEGKMGDMFKIIINSEMDQNKWLPVKFTGVDPGAISGHAGDKLGDRYYLFGGENARGELNSNLFIFDIESSKWEKRIFMDEDIVPLNGHTLTACDNLDNKSLVVFGGFTKGEYSKRIYVYDILKGDWNQIINEEHGTTPEGRVYHTAVANNKNVYIYGGQNKDGKFLSDMWKFDLTNKTWQSIELREEIPKGRSGHTSIIHDNCIYVFGGKTGSIFEVNELWKYEINTNAFVLLHDTLLEQFPQEVQLPFARTQTNILKKKDTRALSLMQISTNIFTDKKNKTMSSLSKASHTHQNQKIHNYEEIALTSPITKSMKGTLIYQLDANDQVFKHKLSTLMTRSYGTEEKIKHSVVPAPRDGHSAVLWNQNFIIFGGDRNKFPFNDLFVFNI